MVDRGLVCDRLGVGVCGEFGVSWSVISVWVRVLVIHIFTVCPLGAAWSLP